MSIQDNQGWSEVERLAQAHERDLACIDTPKVPEPTIAQQLLWASQRCAELQARLMRVQGKAMEASMWLTAGDANRAKQSINAIILDI